MPCSAVTLSVATVAAVLATALLAIAFSTDNWLRVEVKRERLRERFGDELPADFDSNLLYYARTKGLWRVCFVGARPVGGPPVYLSPVETYCTDVDYYIPDAEGSTASLSQDEMGRLHMARATLALFILAFLFLFLAFWTGVAGCWRRSSGNITTTAVLVLVSCLLSAGAMGLWHGVEYYEQEKLSSDSYYRGWPRPLQELSTKQLDWSFYLAWLSVGLSLVSATLFAGAASCLHRENREMAGGGGGGGYLMTVYPQKGVYPPYYPAAGQPHYNY